MIPNITHSTGSGNYLGYDLGDKKEQYQKVQFLAAEGVMIDDRLIDRLNQNWEDGDEEGYQAFRKVSMAIANDLDDQFRARASLNDRPKIRAINVSLSYSPADSDKVNELVYDETRDDYVPLRLKMGREFLDGMGFGDTQYVAVSHLDTHCAHDHYAINTVRADGSTIKLNFDFVRAQKVAVEIREKYGLMPPDKSLQMITPKAREALKQSCTWEEYEQRLQEHGIRLYITDHSKSGRGYGVSYSASKKVIPGSKLHRSLSYGQVDAALKKNLEARQAQEEASRIAKQQELARQKAEAEARAAAQKAAQELARQKAEAEARAAAQKAAQELARQKAEAEARAAAEKAAQEAARQEQEKAAREAKERRLTAEKLSCEPETFVIHGDTDATLYSYRPDRDPKDISMTKKLAMLHEASRSILKYYTWGASVRCDHPGEFVEDAVNGQQFGTVSFDMTKARFIGEDLTDGMLENPEEVIQFADHNGRALNLFTPEFRETWRMRLALLKNLIQVLLSKRKAQSAEKTPTLPKKQEEAPKPAAKPVPESTPVHSPAAAPAAQVPRPVTQVAQQQAAPAPQPAAKPSFEVVQEFKANYYKYRIKKEQDGLMKLQKYEVDKKSPVVNGKYTGHCWRTKETFTSYKEIGRDADGVYFKITDTTGMTRHINQDGVGLSQKKKQQLGIVSKGRGI